MYTGVTEFLKSKTIEEHCACVARRQRSHPDRISVLVDKATSDAPPLDRCKYLVPLDMTVAEFLQIVRKRICPGTFSSAEALFLFVGPNRVMPPTGSLMRTLYKEHAENHGYLVIYYGKETTFGAAARCARAKRAKERGVVVTDPRTAFSSPPMGTVHGI